MISKWMVRDFEPCSYFSHWRWQWSYLRFTYRNLVTICSKQSGSVVFSRRQTPRRRQYRLITMTCDGGAGHFESIDTWRRSESTTAETLRQLKQDADGSLTENNKNRQPLAWILVVIDAAAFITYTPSISNSNVCSPLLGITQKLNRACQAMRPLLQDWRQIDTSELCSRK